MATIAEQLTSLANTKIAIKDAIVAKGVAVADTDPFSAYPSKIQQISGGGAPATKFGVSIDNLLGSVNEYGRYESPTEPFTVDFSGIKTLTTLGEYADGHYFSQRALSYMFYCNKYLTGTVDLSGLEEVGDSSLSNPMKQCFYGTGIKKIIFPTNKGKRLIFGDMCARARLLETVVLDSDVYDSNNYNLQGAFSECESLVEIIGLDKARTVGAFGNTFEKCTSLKTVDVSGIVTLTGNNAMQYTFRGCTELSGGIWFDSLQSVDQRGLVGTFSGDTKLTAAYFPSLTEVQSNSFGAYGGQGPFEGCTGITEIHFRSDAQAVIEALSTYSSKFGATNATICFDLIGTITVDGVAYSRDEPNSIRVDGTKIFVAWKDTDGNIVYTDATAEPAVGTVVYSDQGTTQVGTVSEVA